MFNSRAALQSSRGRTQSLRHSGVRQDVSEAYAARVSVDLRTR